jgi:hypothetical protein
MICRWFCHVRWWSWVRCGKSVTAELRERAWRAFGESNNERLGVAQHQGITFRYRIRQGVCVSSDIGSWVFHPFFHARSA